MTLVRPEIEFVALPGGAFLMGLGTAEEAEARAITPEPRISWESVRPQRLVSVRPLRISVAPITVGQMMELAPGIPLAEAAAGGKNQVARLTRGNAEAAARKLGGRLPTEAEWEYACRAGTDGLFAFGKLPHDYAELEPWMSWDNRKGACNRFGLRTLFTGEWCSDTWRASYEPGAQKQGGVFVLRGGGAYFWPWQDEEWVWCMSAVRSPSTELPDAEWSFRVVVDPR